MRLPWTGWPEFHLRAPAREQGAHGRCGNDGVGSKRESAGDDGGLMGITGSRIFGTKQELFDALPILYAATKATGSRNHATMAAFGSSHGPSGVGSGSPDRLRASPLPISELPRGAVLHRVHRIVHGPMFFGPGPDPATGDRQPPKYRFDSHSGSCGVLNLIT